MATKEDVEVDEKEKAHVKDWLSQIEGALKGDDTLDKRLKDNRAYVSGEKHTDGAKGLVRTNLIFATLAGMLPHIYAKDPDVSISPSKTVSNEQYELVKKFGLTAEIVLDQAVVKEARLKVHVKAALRSTQVTGDGWLKMVLQHDIKTDPLVQDRINDAQDNLQRVNALINEIEEGDGELLKEKSELQIQIKALASNSEVKVYKGMVIDRIMTEDILILDDAVVEFHQYDKAKAIAHRLWYTDDDFEATFEIEAPKGATEFNQRGLKADDKSKATTDPANTKGTKYRCVYEIWDLMSQTVYTVCAGGDQWIRKPYTPEFLASRFYPFFDFGFNVIEGRRRPLSDVELLIELQDEYNSTRTQYAAHRDDSMPVRVVRKGGQLTEGDIKRLQERKSREIVAVEGDGGRALSEDMQEFAGVPIDPNVYDVTQIRNDMDLVSGMSDASRGNLIQPKTATEAELMSQSMATRVDERRDVVEDVLTDMFDAALEVLLQALSLDAVKKIAGPDSVWPSMDKDEIRAQVHLSIRGGSTSKPNKAKEQEQWGQVMPIIKDTMESVAKLRMAGQNDMAKAAVELLKETLSRFDERIDVETFIPRETEDGQMSPEQQVQQLTQQLQTAQQNMQQLETAAKSNQKQEAAAQEKLIALQNEPELARVKAQADIDIADIKAEADKLIAKSKADADSAIASAKTEAETEFKRFDTIVNAATQLVIAGIKQDGAAEQANAQRETDLQSTMIDTIMSAVSDMGDNHMNAIQTLAQTMHSALNTPKRAIYDQQGNIVGSVPDKTLAAPQDVESAPESQGEDAGEQVEH